MFKIENVTKSCLFFLLSLFLAAPSPAAARNADCVYWTAFYLKHCFMVASKCPDLRSHYECIQGSFMHYQLCEAGDIDGSMELLNDVGHDLTECLEKLVTR